MYRDKNFTPDKLDNLSISRSLVSLVPETETTFFSFSLRSLHRTGDDAEAPPSTASLAIKPRCLRARRNRCNNKYFRCSLYYSNDINTGTDYSSLLRLNCLLIFIERKNKGRVARGKIHIYPTCATGTGRVAPVRFSVFTAVSHRTSHEQFRPCVLYADQFTKTTDQSPLG
jgi:hypothetical protein